MKLSKLGQKITESGLTVKFVPEDEFLSPKNQLDPSLVDEIEQRMQDGDVAAWFCAKVSVGNDSNMEAVDYLGCCSYANLDEFTSEEGGYFDDMLRNCLDELVKLCDEAAKTKVIVGNLMQEA